MRLVGFAACCLAAVLNGCSAPPAKSSEMPTPYAGSYEASPWAVPPPPPPGYWGNYPAYTSPPATGSFGPAPAFVFPTDHPQAAPAQQIAPAPQVAAAVPVTILEASPAPIETKPLDTRPRMGAVGQF